MPRLQAGRRSPAGRAHASALVGLAELEELVVGALLVQHTLLTDLDDAGRNGLHKLMVVRREQHRALEITHAIVDRGDGFQIEVVGRLAWFNNG